MLAVMLIYLLMATPVWCFATASLTTHHARAAIGVKMAGLIFIKEIEPKHGEWSAQTGLQALRHFLERRQTSALSSAFVRRLVQSIRHCTHVDELEVALRIGLDEAWSTALATGSAYAAICSALGAVSLSSGARVQIIPDFTASCFCVHLRCIFSVTLGDIMLSVIKTALKSSERREENHGAASHRKPDGHFYGKHPRNGGREYGHR